MDLKLETLGVPDAITKTLLGVVDSLGHAPDDAVMETIVGYAEQLESRIQDAIISAQEVVDAPDGLQAMDAQYVVDATGSVMSDLNGHVFHLSCNEWVGWSPDDQEGDTREKTFCIKRYGHQGPIHEDIWGYEVAAR